MDIGQEHQERRRPHALGQPEFSRRLERIREVGSGVGEAEDLRARALRLQEVGRKSDVPSGTRTSPATVPPPALTTSVAPLLELRAEGIVGGEEEPALAALVEDRLGRAVGERGRVVAVVDRVGVQSLPVSDAPAAPIAKNGTFFSLAAAAMARLTPVLDPPSSMVRPSVSAHSRNFCPPMSGLF